MRDNQARVTRTLGVLAVLAAGLTATTRARGDEAVYERALPTLACVLSPKEGDKVSAGSAVLVEVRRGLLLTAYHIVEDRPAVLVFFPARDSRGELITDPVFYREHIQELGIVGRVVAADATKDLALIRLDRVPSGAKATTIARRSPKPGQEVFAIGNSGLGDGVLWRYRDGKVRQVYRKTIHYGTTQKVEARVIETTVPTNGGDSGGPIVNGDGELVAITTGRDSEEVGVDYGIDVAEIRSVLAAFLPSGDLLDGAEVPPVLAPNPAPKASARLEEVRSVHNVVRDGKAGMEVHFKAVVSDALGRPCDFLLTVCDEDRKPLTSRTAGFTLPNGALGDAARLTPKYAVAVFPDVTLFVTYEAINAAADGGGQGRRHGRRPRRARPADRTLDRRGSLLDQDRPGPRGACRHECGDVSLSRIWRWGRARPGSRGPAGKPADPTRWLALHA